MTRDFFFSNKGLRYADVAFLAACFVFIYLHVFYRLTIPIYYEADHVNLLNDAKRLIEGEFIYRDYFEFIFPGAVSVYALLMEIFGPKYLLVNIVVLVHGVAAAYLGLKISRKVMGDSAVAYLPSAIFVFFGFRWFGVDGEHRFLSPLFSCIAILVLLPRRNVKRVALAGVACALSSFFTQQRGVLTVAALLSFLAIEFWFVDRDFRRLLKLSLTLTGAFLLSITVIVLPFVLIAGPATFFSDTILFLSVYAKDGEFNSIQSYFLTLEKFRSQGILVWVVSLFYSLLVPFSYFATLIFVGAKRKSLAFSEVSGALLTCLVGLFLSIGTSGPNVPRLYQTALPACVVFVWMLWRSNVLKPTIARPIVAALIILGFSLAIRLQTVWDIKVIDTPSGTLAFINPVARERYEWLLENAEPGEYVYEVYNSNVNFILNLPNPSRMSILLNTGYTPPEHVAWALEDLKRRKPRYIIWDGTWTGEMEQLSDGERLKPLYELMSSRYHPVKTFTPYDGRERQIWERNAN